jgi:hypothetical protein
MDAARAAYHPQLKNLLDVHRVHDRYLGLPRDAFERVSELGGFQLTPVNGVPEVWDFRGPATSLRGRLLDVSAHLYGDPVALTSKGRAYMITRQDFTLALMLPGAPWRLRLNETRHKQAPPGARTRLPPAWPPELVTRVIRARFREIVVLNEQFLLEQIGLRAPR